MKVDRQWDDTGLFLSPLLPDTEYVLRRMTELCLEMATAEPGAMVLDIGCGAGRDIWALAQRSLKVFGLDASKAMLIKSRQSFGRQDTQLFLIEGIGEQLPFKTSSFKVILCKGAIDHFYNPFMALQEMKRVVQPDGWIVLAMANFESLSCQLSKLIYRLRSSIFPAPLVSYSPERKFWEMPADHQYKFDFFLIREIIERDFPRVKSFRGLSLLWGFPRWGRFLQCLPTSLSQAILRVLDDLANKMVFWSDIIIVALEKGRSISN